MTPNALARLHARANDRLRPWSAAEFADLLANPCVFLCSVRHGFALGRAVAGEAELLAIATDPDHRRQGIARHCLSAFEAIAIERRASRALLEVDSKNLAAISLYASSGYSTMASRPAYYGLRDGTRADALVMARSLRP